MRSLIATAVLLSLSCPAAAQPSEAQVSEARRIFEEAEAEFGSRHFQDAARLYLESYSMLDGHENQYLVLFNVAQSLAESAHYDEAIQRFHQYLREGGSRVQNRGEVDARIAELEDLRGRSGSGGDSGLMVPAIALLSVGGLGLIGTGIFGGLALAEHDSLAEGCGATRSCTSDDVSTSDTFALVADVSLIVGGAALAAGVVLLIVALSESASDDVAALLMNPRAVTDVEVLRW